MKAKLFLAAAGAAILPTTYAVVQASSAHASGYCGDNYTLVKSITIHDGELGTSVVGHINVQYNSDNGYWCAVANTEPYPYRISWVKAKRPAMTWANAVSAQRDGTHAEVWIASLGGRCVDVRGGAMARNPDANGYVEPTRVCR